VGRFRAGIERLLSIFSSLLMKKKSKRHTVHVVKDSCREHQKGNCAKVKPQKNPEKNIGSNHILILGEENFLII